MKEKIFAKLKQEYSHLGLGSDILLGQAEALANTGFVTDENVDLVVAAQKGFLEGLQKQNDKRVDDALKKEREKFESETRRKAEEEEAAKAAQVKAEEEAKAKAAKEKKEAEEKAAKEAEEKTAAEAKAAEEAAALKKAMELDQLPAAVTDIIKAERERAAKERQEYEQRISEMQANDEKTRNDLLESIKKMQESHNALTESYNAIRKENEEAKAAKARADREAFILNKAKSLGVPQWRIEEGFNITPDATDDVIVDTLTHVAENIKTQMLPNGARTSFPINSGSLSQNEIKSLADVVVK